MKVFIVSVLCKIKLNINIKFDMNYLLIFEKCE